jgi:hypothetical protein
MIARSRVAIGLAAAALLVPCRGAAATRLRGIVLDRPLTAAVLPVAVSRMPIVVRIALEISPLDVAAAEEKLRRLQFVVGEYHSLNIPVLISLDSMPETDGDIESWRRLVGLMAEQGRNVVAGYQIGRVIAGTPPDVTRYAYLLKLAAVQVRAIDPAAIVLQGDVPSTEIAWQERVLAAEVGPYVDGFAIGATDADDQSSGANQSLTALLNRVKPSATIVSGPIELSSDAGVAASQMVDRVLRAVGTTTVMAFTGPTTSVQSGLGAVSHNVDLVAGDLVALDARSNKLIIRQGASDITSTIRLRFVYDLAGFATFLVYWSPAGDDTLVVEASVANATMPMIRDPMTGMLREPAHTEQLPGSNGLRLAVPRSESPLVIDFNYGNSSAFGATVNVHTEALPRVEEIIFRNQRAQAAQDNVLQTFTAHARIEHHFRATPADPAYNVVTENRLYYDHGEVEWEEFSFELNGAKWTSNRPPFPLIQPEKVLSLPLDLRLNQDYAYKLEGTDTVGGRPAFVIRFDPVEVKRALYRGTVWIDRETFVRLKVQAVETTQNGPVISNDETQIYESPGAIGDQAVWILTRLVSKQIFLIAGRSVLVEREVRLTDMVLNSQDFEQERATARASRRIMYRDTDQGIRYFVKQGSTRVVSDRLTTSARAIALGAVFDPSLDFPLPIGGLNILDFNFMNRNSQLALLWGGVIAFGNLQRANLLGGRLDTSVDFFGLGVKSNDDVFDANGKRQGERVNRIPISTGLNVGYRLSPFQRVTGHYEFKYDWYFPDDTTAPDFVVPSSTATQGEGAGYEYRRRGYSLLANATAYQRSSWTPWGASAEVEDFDSSTGTFTKYDIGLSKDFTFSTFHTVHLNGTYFGGQRLDRFSMYQFGLFDATRMHGVPSAVRFADLAMFRGSYSFNVFEQYRVDVFFDRAGGRDAEDPTWRHVAGTGFRLSMRAPHDTILQVDFGKSFLPTNYQGAGSTVWQIMLLKPL